MVTDLECLGLPVAQDGIERTASAPCVYHNTKEILKSNCSLNIKICRR